MKSFEDFTFEMLDQKEELDKAIRAHESAVKRMRQKNRKIMGYILVLLAVAVVLFTITTRGISGFWYQGGLLYRPLAWVTLVCLVAAFYIAHRLYRQQSRFRIEEKRLRQQRELATEQYAEAINQLDKLRNAARKAQHPPTMH